jgi:ferredoxin-NADP reductase
LSSDCLDADDCLNVRVHAVRYEAEDARSLELRALGGELPPFTAGAHLDIDMPGGIRRSLCVSKTSSDLNA